VPQIKAVSPSEGWTAGRHYIPDILQGCTRTPWCRRLRPCPPARGGRQAVRLSSLSERTSSTGCRSSSGPSQSGASSSPLTPSGSRPHPGRSSYSLTLISWNNTKVRRPHAFAVSGTRSIPPPTHASTTIKATSQGVTKRCRLSWLTNSALVFEPKCGGRGGGGGHCGVSANEYSCTQEPK
jgi:hypothetical protein